MGETTSFVYAKAPAPEVAGTYTFATVVRGDDVDGRNLLALALIDGVSAIDSIVVGPVLPGNGIAWISSPVAADYTETGPLPGGSGDLDGDEMEFTVPSAMDPPQNTNSTVNGYVSVTTTGSPVIGVLSFPTLNSQAVVVPTTTMKKGDTISVTYKVDDADITNVLDSHIFTVKTRLDTAQSFSDGSVIAAQIDYELSSSGNTLKLNVESVEGKGAMAVVGSDVYRKGFVATNLTFRYTAASLTGAIRLEVPTGGVTRMGGVTNTTSNGKIGWTVIK